MALNDILSDTIARIKNAQAVNLDSTKVIKSSLVAQVLEVLKNEGFIDSFNDIKDDKNHILVTLKYVDGRAVIREFNRVSKPGRRVYSKISDLSRFYNGLGVVILSTPKGVKADHEARELKVGGEVLCSIF
jgi:small subunit ribosomal protein S8